MPKRPILVPTDFSEVGETALNHAIKIAQTAETRVILLHVVKDVDMVEDARTKLSKAKAEAQNIYQFEVETSVRVGNIMDDISEMAAEIDAALVVMGTKGLRGIQWLTGGGAVRIVTNSKTPFVIVQKEPIGPNGYDDIVVPLDLHKETKQKLSLVADAAKFFNSCVHILVPKEKDEFLHNRIERNMKYASNFFSEQGISHTTQISSYGSDEFDEGIIEFAKEIDADLISIMNLPGISLLNLIGGNFVQNIITNEHQIPVLVLNPKKVSHVSIFGAYLGR
jgi:nucleotide-binding universal stress UspA family protein